MSKKGIKRREFVRQAGQAVAGAALGGILTRGGLAAPAAKADTSNILNYNAKMGYRPFGRTGVMISEVGLGGHWKTPTGGRYWDRFPNDDPPADVQKARNEVWVKAAECGINYLDITTAAETVIYGRCMKQTGVPMHVGYSDHILCMRDKNNRSVERLTVEIDEGLRRLMVDRLWFWRPQALMEGGHTPEEIENVVAAYDNASKAGKVLYLGMSTHNHEFVRWVLDKWGDKFHGFVFLYSVSHEPKASGSMFETIAKKNVGAVGLKPFHGDGYFRDEMRKAEQEKRPPALDDIAVKGLKKILEVPELTCTIPGMTIPAEVENDVKASYERASGLTDAERRAIREAALASAAHLPPDYAWIRDQGICV